MKLKEFGPWKGARPKVYYVDPPLECKINRSNCLEIGKVLYFLQDYMS